MGGNGRHRQRRLNRCSIGSEESSHVAYTGPRAIRALAAGAHTTTAQLTGLVTDSSGADPHGASRDSKHRNR